MLLMPPPLVVAELLEIVELMTVRVLPLTLELIKIPPPVAAVLLATVELLRVRVPRLLKIPPPLVVAELLEIVELLMVNVPPLTMPPPCKVAKFPEIVELSRVKVAPKGLKIPPPSPFAAVLPEMVELVMVRMPPLLFRMPPPVVAELPEMVELETVRVPELLKAPPLPEVFAPETVTPEIERLPPAAMLKMLKLRFVLMVPEELSRPLIIREEEPGPVMVRVPTVPPPPEAVALAFKMVGNEAGTVLFWESSVMVPVMLKLIMSSPAVALASIMACRRDPAPASALVDTKMGEFEGTILCSRLRSSGRGREEALRAFLFWELVKSLRKAFKSMEIFLIPKPKKEANRRALCIGGATKV